MVESRVISVRVSQDLLDAIDRLAAEHYPSRRSGEPNRSIVLLDALEAYLKHPVDEVTGKTRNVYISSTSVNNVNRLSTEQLMAIVDNRIQYLREDLLGELRGCVLGECSA